MKLLVIARNYQFFVSRQATYHLIEELKKETELITWHERGTDIRIILDTLKILPDFILILEYFETNATKVTGLCELTIPFAVSFQDLHWDIDMRTRLVQGENIRHIFTASKHAFNKMYPELKERMIWLPHHVNTELFKDYELPKEIDLLLMGSASQVYYPFRAGVLNAMRDKTRFVYHKHPGYRDIMADENEYVRERYAREINRAKIFFTCGGTFQYPVAKYFEVLASNTLLLAPTFSEIEELGFIPDVHFVAVDESNFEEKAEYYLQHEDERRQIAKQGYEMVREKHSTARRVTEFLSIIEGIIHKEEDKRLNT